MTVEPLKLAAPPTAGEERRAEALAILKKYVELAESGQVESVILIVNVADAGWIYDESRVPNFCEAIGQLEVVKHGWIEAYRRSHGIET